MTLDIEKHRETLLRAFNEVVSDKKPTDWVLYGYEGQTNVLKLVGTGEDGLEELADDLNSSKIMYAVVRVIDPNTTRPKIVLINWQGEGAPTVRKGTCARHLHDIHKLLCGVHVTVNARTEEEVEPDVVMAAVLKASATTYNFNERSEMNDKTTPVRVPGIGVSAALNASGHPNTNPVKPKQSSKPKLGTNYKRTNPLAEINSKSRNKFWEEQEEEEKRRKLEEQKLKDEELKRLEVERKQREISETRHRDNLTRERNARITEERRAEDVAFQRMASREDKKWEQDLESHHREEEERSKRAEQMRLERKREAEALIGKRTHAARDRFELGMGVEQKQEFQITPADRNRPPPRRLKEFKPVNDQREENRDMVAGGGGAPGRGVMVRWPPAAADPPHLHNQHSTAPLHLRGERMASGTSTKVRTPVQDIIPAPSSPPAPPSKQQPSSVTPVQAEMGNSGHVRNLLCEGLPIRQAASDEEDNADKETDEWQDNPPQNTRSIPPPNTIGYHPHNFQSGSYHEQPPTTNNQTFVARKLPIHNQDFASRTEARTAQSQPFVIQRQPSSPTYTQQSISQNQPSPTYTQQTVSQNQHSPTYTQQLTSQNQPSPTYTQQTLSQNQPSPTYNQQLVSQNQPFPTYTQQTVSQNQPSPTHTQRLISQNQPSPTYTQQTVSHNQHSPTYTQELISQNQPSPTYTQQTVSHNQHSPTYTQELISQNQPSPTFTQQTVSQIQHSPTYTQQLVSQNQPSPTYTQQPLSQIQHSPTYTQQTISQNQPSPTYTHNQPPPTIYNNQLPPPTTYNSQPEPTTTKHPYNPSPYYPQGNPEPPEASSTYTNGDGGSHLYENAAADAFSLVGGGDMRQQTTTQNGTTHHVKTTAAAASSVNSTTMDDYYESSVQNNSATTTTTAISNADNANDTPAIGMLYEVDGVEYQILPEHGLCARALYDYQAADDTEITFDPSEIITNIDQIDEGWWQGVGPDGMYGLFPANYVELINQAPA